MATAVQTAADWMFKEDAAKLLKTNPRSIERISRQGKVQRKYLPRRANEKQARVVYSRADLLAYRDQGEGPARDPVTKQPNPAPALVPMRATAGLLSDMLAVALRGGALPTARPAPRAWLTLAEAVEYSGLPGSYLAELLRTDQVDNIGRGPKTWRIRRASLDAYGEYREAATR